MRSHARPSSWATFFLVLLGAVTAGPGAAEDRDTFTEDGVLNGSATTEEACRWPDTSIWVVVDGQGDCLRYFHGGLKPRNQVIHVWLHGDRMWQDVAGRKGWYKGVGEAELEKIALARYAKDEIPYVGLSRPGTYGSSGNHAERRRPREVKLVLAAFDELKARYGVERFAISGFSSGGHLVGALLAKRNDIVCAVAASGVLAVRQRIQWRGWVTDITGFSDYYDPITHVDRIPSDANRRIFIIGDPRDINAPFVAQESYAKEVARHGHAVWLMKAEGVDRARHYLGGKELNVAKWCLDGETAESIEKMIGYRDP